MNKKNKRNQNSNRGGKKRFLLLPYEIITGSAYKSLSNKAVKCLVDIAGQFNGVNNGDLSCTIKLMKKLGWNSKSQLELAKNELLEKGFIVLTRQGGLNKCSLFAVTWHPIDDCKGKLDRPETVTALGYWKQGENPEFVKKKLKSVPRIQGKCAPNSGVVTEINKFSVSH